MKKPPLEIDIQFACKTHAPTAECLTEALTVAWNIIDKKHQPPTSHVAIKVIDEDEMTQLNKQYRDKNGPTNVLSFPTPTTPGCPQHLLGDIAICATVVWREANEANIPLAAHWAHLTIHGLLHLLGYDHETDTQANEMQALEIKALHLLGWPNPYAHTH